jgi:hypothetical protein
MIFNRMQVLFMGIFLLHTLVVAQSYEVKSGVIEMTISGVQKGTSVLYFDDYGKKVFTENRITYSFQKGKKEVHTGILVTGDSTYNIFYDSQSYLVFSDNDTDLDEDEEDEEIDYKNATPIGKETILGKPCKIYQDDETKVWIWNGIPLKMITGSGSMETRSVAKAVSVGKKIPASRFKVPAGFTRKENAVEGLMEGLDNIINAQEMTQEEYEAQNEEESKKNVDESIQMLKGLFQ